MNIPVSFPISVFENSGEKISDTLTKKRVRIFYRGENRNGSYISDEFAEQLLKTLPYAPVKGIYNEDDFEGHGKKRTEGRIYGVVPENPNTTWEKHLDEDGVEREYACADVYLFTALYEEANEIDGKGQSMELYGPSIKGEWIRIGGKELYRYTDACFLGLQVLGDNATPCFQGSAFFSLEGQQLYSLFTALLEKIDKLTQGGENQMENTLTFALSDNQKQNAIFKALNTETVRYFVMDTYEEYAIVFDMETEKIEKVGFTKNEDDTVTVSDQFEELFAEYVTSAEKEALSALRSKTEEGTYEATVASYDANSEKVSNMETELNDKNTELSTLQTEKENAENKIGELNGQIESYEAELNTLRSFKETADKQAKETIIAKYSERLPEDVLNDFTAKMNEFTVVDLEKELAYKLVQTDSSIFTHKEEEQHYVPTGNEELTGVQALLAKHKNS